MNWLITKERNLLVHLLPRTLGDLYADTAQGAKNGIELAFDSILKGHDGITHRQKVMK